MTERVTDERAEHREEQAGRRVARPALRFRQHHRREHDFRRDRKNDRFDETESGEITLRMRMRGPFERAFVERLEQLHRRTIP
jgi:hypothetical protein